MRILMMDDDKGYPPFMAEWLRDKHGFDVKLAEDPHDALRLLKCEAFHVAVVDIRIAPLADAFLARVKDETVDLLIDTEFLVSGLTTLFDAKTIGRRPDSDVRRAPGTVVWTSGEGARGLQLPFAQQELGVSVFCSNLSPKERLLQAIRRAEAGQPYIDTKLRIHLPEDDAKLKPKPVRTLFKKEAWGCIWRALALGSYNPAMVSDITGMKERTVRDHVGAMRTMLLTEIDAGASYAEDNKTATAVLYGYAKANREFFLDDLVMRMFRPPCARGLARRSA